MLLSDPAGDLFIELLTLFCDVCRGAVPFVFSLFRGFLQLAPTNLCVSNNQFGLDAIPSYLRSPCFALGMRIYLRTHVIFSRPFFAARAMTNEQLLRQDLLL